MATRPVKTSEQLDYTYGPEMVAAPRLTLVMREWFIANPWYSALFDAKANPYARENDRAFMFSITRYNVPSMSALDFAIEEALECRRLINPDGSVAIKYIAPEAPLEPVDYNFLEEIGQMPKAEVARRFTEDPNSRWCRRYKIASQQSGYEMPHGHEIPIVVDEDPFAGLTQQQYQSMPPNQAARLYMDSKSFRDAIAVLRAAQLI
jgi:hypothetical protein